MGRKLILAIAAVFGLAGFMLAQADVKAKSGIVNLIINKENTVFLPDKTSTVSAYSSTGNVDNSLMKDDNGSTVNADEPTVNVDRSVLQAPN